MELKNSTPEERKKATTRFILLGVGIILSIVVMNYFTGPPPFDQQLMYAASELNKTAPIMIDRETRFDNAVALPEKELRYFYTLINQEKEEINLKELEESMKPIMLNTFKSNPTMKAFNKNGVTMSFNYNDKNGVFLFLLKFKPEDYK